MCMCVCVCVHKFTRNILHRVIGFFFDSHYFIEAYLCCFRTLSSPVNFSLILVFLPVSTEIRRKAIKSQPAVTDSPQILRVKRERERDSSCILSLVLSFRYDYRNNRFTRCGRGSLQTIKEKENARTSCLNRTDSISHRYLSSPTYSAISRDV